MVKVPAIASYIDEPVDGAASPEHLAAGPVQSPPTHCRDRLSEVAPVEALVPVQPCHPRRCPDPKPPGRRTRFNQQHPYRGIIAESSRQHAACRPGTYHHLVEFLQAPLPWHFFWPLT